MKIAIYAISKNEEKFAERCIRSCEDADLFLLTDTGSTDMTVPVAKGLGAKVYNISVQPFRFDDARNTCLSLIPADYDICISVDMDEIMMPGWREDIEKHWKSDTTRMSYLFDWGSGLQFKSDKIHARNGYRWVKPCHECLVPTRIAERFVYSEELLVKHLPDSSKSRSDYFPLLEVSYNENPTDPRALLYFGRELYFRNDLARAIKILNKYIEVSTWQAEKAYAILLIGDVCAKMGDFGTALLNYHESARNWPQYRDPFLRIANYHHSIKNWEDCLKYSEAALSITNRVYHYFEDQKSWGSYPYDLAALASYYIGDKAKAIEYGNKAIELDPSDPRLITNLEFYK